MPKQIICKSCRVPCEVDGDEITCPKCGSTFVRQAGGEVRVKEVGRLDKIEQRLDQLTNQIQTNLGPATEQEEEAEGEQAEDNDW